MKIVEVAIYLVLASLLCATAYYSVYLPYQKAQPAKEEQAKAINCNDYPMQYADYCIYQTSDALGDLTQRVKKCAEIKRDGIRAYCIIDAVTSRAQENPYTDVQGMCKKIGDDIFRGECFFRSSEILSKVHEDYEGAYTLCKGSADFEYDCIAHLEEAIHTKNAKKALEFCKRVEKEYKNESEVPIVYCYHHFGLGLGRGGQKPCDMLDTCEEAGTYLQSCIRGVFNTLGNVDVNCP